MKRLFLILLFLTIHSTYAGEGGQAGNGVTYIRRESVVAWFPPGATPTYCIQSAALLSSQFYDQQRLSDLIKWAFGTWNVYNISKKVTPKGFDKNFTIHPQQSQADGSCKGDENITFYFGVSDKRTELLRNSRDISFAEMDFMNKTSDSSRGVVWFSPPFGVTKNLPDWNLEGALEGTLLHEVGHIFGNEHVDGTIMQEDFFQFADSTKHQDRRSLSGRLRSIDAEKELYTCASCGFEMKGTTHALAFQQITQKDAVGPISATLEQKMGSETISYFLTLEAEVKAKSNQTKTFQSRPMEIEFKTVISEFFGTASIFKTWVNEMENPQGLKPKISVQKGTLQAGRKSLEVFILRNNSKSVSVCMEIAGKCKEVFTPLAPRTM